MMIDVDQIRTHVLDLRRRGARFVGHRALLARLLDEIDALTAALRAAHNPDVWYWAAIASREAIEPTKERIEAKVSALLPGALDELHKAILRADASAGKERGDGV